MRHVSSGQRSWIHSRKTPSHLVFVIFVTDEGDSRQLDQTMLAVRTTHSRVAQGAQTIHSLWNLRLTQVTNRTNRIFFSHVVSQNSSVTFISDNCLACIS